MSKNLKHFAENHRYAFTAVAVAVFVAIFLAGDAVVRIFDLQAETQHVYRIIIEEIIRGHSPLLL